MSLKRATLLLSAAFVLGGAAGASAADLYGGSIKDGPVMMAPMPGPMPSWYVRVDGGYAGYDTPAITEDHYFDLVNTDIDNTWTVGGGIGRYFGNGFRGDVTIDHRFESDVTGNLADPLSNLPGTRTFGLKSTVVLANLYYDFDLGSRLTPYIGVGLGFSHNSTEDGTVNDPCGCLTGTIEGDSQTDVAAALMAGLSVKLRGGTTTVPGSFKDGSVTVDSGRSLFLDVGYRFLYLGEAATGPVNATYTAPVAGGHGGSGTVSQDPIVEDIHAHELRVGLRYNLN